MRKTRRVRLHGNIWLTVSLGALAMVGRVVAQEAEEPTLTLEAEPLRLEAPPAPVELSPIAESPAEEPAVVAKANSAFNERRFGYVFHGQAKAEYQSNVFISPNHAQADLIFTIAPGLAVGLGDFKSELLEADQFHYRFDSYTHRNYLFLDYTPSGVLFVDHSSENLVGHDLRLQGEYNFSKLTVGVRGQFLHASVPSEDIGDRVELTHLSGALTSSYAVSDKTSLETNLFYDDNRYDESGERSSLHLIDNAVLRAEEWLNFQVMPKTKLGFGLAGGFLDRSEGPSETFEQAQVRVRWEASDKLAIGLTAGVEFRQVDDAGDETNGVFALGLGWTPTERLSTRLEAFRRVVPSGAVGEVYTETGFQLGLRQQLLDRYFCSFAAGYSRAEYEGAVESGRQDDLYFLRPSVGLGLNRWLTCEIVGEYRSDASSLSERSFDNTTASLIFNVLF